jgi:hypothetical protein
VNQRLGEFSVKRMNDQLKISRTVRRVERKFQIEGGQGVEIRNLIDCQEDSQGISIASGQWIEIAMGSHRLLGGQQKVSSLLRWAREQRWN